MKKKIILAALLVVFSLNAYSQNWLWARTATGLGYQEGFSIATDDSGNVFVAGECDSSAITFGTTTLTTAGARDIFLAKYSATGNVLWAKREGGTGDDWCYSITTDDSGNVFLAGYFLSSTIIFGTTTLTNTGSADFCLVKYSRAGNVLWAKSATGTGYDEPYASSTDASGNIFVTGFFESPTITFGTTTLANAGNRDIFLVKYDGSGNVLWVKYAGGNRDDWGFGAATDASGNIFIVGSFSSATLLFDSDTLTNADNSGNSADIFITKYDGAGNIIWAKRAGGTAADGAYGLAVDASGNAFITGAFGSPVITFGTTSLYHIGSAFSGDVFTAKYDASGNALWAKWAGGTNNDVAYSIANDASGNAYICGSFSFSSIVFDSDTLLLPSGGADPMFLAGYNSSGNLLCASALASGGDDQNAIATDAFGNVFVGGDFYLVNPFIIGTDSLPLTGGENIFVAKFNCGVTSYANEFSNKEEINLYPNPVTNQLTISSNHPEVSGVIKSVEIWDVVGEKIFALPLNPLKGTSASIDVSKLAPGIYFVKVREEKNEERVAKFVKE